MYTLEFVQAVNDWQRGGDARQKARRGRKLKDLANTIDPKFRSSQLCCFRQIALDKRSLWDLLAENRLGETISAWTTDLAIARRFKGGVPPEGQGWQGVIFVLEPKAGHVVLNLSALYHDPQFQQAVASYRSDINAYSDGIGTYGNTQAEVIIELERLDGAQVYAMGGFSSDRHDLARQLFGHVPSPEELEIFDRELARTGAALGPAWIEDEAVDRVVRRMQPAIEELRRIKKLQDDAQSARATASNS